MELHTHAPVHDAEEKFQFWQEQIEVGSNVFTNGELPTAKAVGFADVLEVRA